MRLQELTVSPSMRTPGYTRATGNIVFDNDETLQIWVDVPDAMAGDLSDNGNPWLVAMLPIAASRHEDIQLSLSVDALLLENIKGVSRIWASWYKDLSVVKIDCPVHSWKAAPVKKATAAFFSGGIDSYYTIARRIPENTNEVPVVGHVDELLSVWGFDVSINDANGFRPLAEQLTCAATQINRSHALVHTNLRDNDTVWMRLWGPLTHGAGLAFIALILEKCYAQVFLGSSFPAEAELPWGSHPLVDALFSTSTMQLVNDGASSTRIDKTDLVAKYAPAQTMLHVCQAMATGNCSECVKCFRTMISLDLLGHKKRMESVFDWSRYDVAAINNLSIISAGEKIYFNEILAKALEINRTDVSDRLKLAMVRSNLQSPFIKIGERMLAMPFLWRAGELLIKIAKHKSIKAHYISHPAAGETT